MWAYLGSERLPTTARSASMRSSRVLVIAAASVAAAAGAVLAGTLPAGAAGGSFGPGAPEFVTSAAPSGIDKGFFANVDFAGEPSIGVNWNSGAALYQASNSPYKVPFDNSSGAPAVAWSDVSSPYSLFNV